MGDNVNRKEERKRALDDSNTPNDGDENKHKKIDDDESGDLTDMSIHSYNSIPSRYNKSDKSIIKEVDELSFADTSFNLNNDLPFTPKNDHLLTSTLNDPLSVEKSSTGHKEK